jgi:hypothetical protein
VFLAILRDTVMEVSQGMTRTAGASPRRRRTSRPQLAGREAFDKALTELDQLQPRAAKENIASEYLPRFVNKLRELGYKQDDIVKTIVAMNLGVTERQIRLADSAWTKEHAKARASSTNGSGGGGAPRRAPDGGSGAKGGGTGGAGGSHAGLAGGEALRR